MFIKDPSAFFSPGGGSGGGWGLEPFIDKLDLTLTNINMGRKPKHD